MGASRQRILIVQRDRTAAGAFAYQLRQAGLAAVAVETLEEALDALALGTPDAVVADLEAREDEGTDGLTLARAMVGVPTRLLLVAERAPTREQELAVLRLGASELAVRAPGAEDVARLVERMPARPLGACDEEGPAEGDLAAWSVERLLAVAERHRLDARLEVASEESSWTLGVRDGRVVQAHGGEAQGAAAAIGALRVTAGAWRLELIDAEAAARLGPDVIRRSLEQLASGSVEADDELADGSSSPGQRRGTDPGGFKLGPRSVRARVQTDPGDARRIRRQVGIPVPTEWARAASAEVKATGSGRKSPERPEATEQTSGRLEPAREGVRGVRDEVDAPTVPDGALWAASEDATETETPAGRRQAMRATGASTRPGRARLIRVGAPGARREAAEALEAQRPEPPAETPRIEAPPVAVAPRPAGVEAEPVVDATPSIDLTPADGAPRRRLLTRARLSAWETGDGKLEVPQDAIAAAADAEGESRRAAEAAAEAVPEPVAALVEAPSALPTEPEVEAALQAEPEPRAEVEPREAPERPVPMAAVRRTRGGGRAPGGAGWKVAVAALAALQIGLGAALAWWVTSGGAGGEAAVTGSAGEAAAEVVTACQRVARHEDGLAWTAWEALARECLATEPANPVALARLGVALYEQDRLAEAGAALEALRAAAPGEAELELRLGFVRLAAGERVEAREAFEAFVARAPADDGLRARLAEHARAGAAGAR